MMAFSTYVEVGGDGWCTAWVGELLGFFLNEPSEAGDRPDAAGAHRRRASTRPAFSED